VPVIDEVPGEVPAVAVKVAEMDAAGTITEAGTETSALLRESITEAPPEGAAALSVTVQLLEALAVTVVGLQLSADKFTGAGAEALTETVANLEVPFSDALIVLV
jgi:hypothetical protein